MKNENKFEFPKKLLTQINECSNGGFILFNVDSDGLPQAYSEFDNPMAAMALQYYIDNWTKAIDAVNLSTTVKEIAGEEDDPDSEEGQ